VSYNNFRQFEGGLRIKGTFFADPVLGQVGEIYFNTASNSFRYCYSDSPVAWKDLDVSAGSVNGSILRWDSGLQKWVENTTVVTGANFVAAPDNADVDNAPAQSLTVSGGNKTDGTGDGGDITVSGGTSVGGTAGNVYLSGTSVIFDVGSATDPISAQNGQVYYNTTANQFKYYNGTIWTTLGSGSGGIIKVTAYDGVNATLPTIDPTVIDGYTILDQDTVLFTSLSVDNNQIYQATVASGTITWTALNAFNQLATPTNADQVIVQNGDSFANQVGTFDGTTFKFNETVRHFFGLNYWEQSGLLSASLSDNSTGEIFSVNVTGSENMVIDYSIIRGSNKTTGTLHITSDGTTADVADTGVDLGTVGVSFDATVTLGVLALNYTADNSGSSATMKYNLRRWSDAAGGPAGPPSYNVGGSGITAAGVDTQIQFNDGGDIGADAGLTFTKSSATLQIGGLNTTGITQSVLLDNTTGATLVSIPSASYPFAVIEFGIIRNGAYETGRILVATDGITPNITTDSTYTGSTGITFSVTQSGGDTLIQYNATNTGFNGTISYSTRKWQ